VPELKDVTCKNAKPKLDKDGKLVRSEIACSVRDGLRLVAQPSGHKSFVYRYWFGKTYKKLTLGTYPTMTLATAIVEHRKAADDKAAGNDPAIAFKKKRSGDVDADATVTAHVAKYKEQRLPKLAKSTATYITTELARITDALGNKDIAKVTPNDCQKLIDAAIKRGPSAQRTTWKVCKAFFAWAARRAGIDSPCANVGQPSKDNERKRWLKDDEIRVVWAAADAAVGTPGALIKLLLLTGCWRDEICYLRRAEVKADKLEFPESRTKNDEPHTVPITPAIRRVLDTLPKSGEYILTGADAGLGGHSKARAAIKTPDLAHWTYHDLRRSFASGMARLGVPIHLTELCLNHKSGISNKPLVRIYQQHDYEAEVKAAFEQWSAHVESLISDAIKVAA
jgi:integrase